MTLSEIRASNGPADNDERDRQQEQDIVHEGERVLVDDRPVGARRAGRRRVPLSLGAAAMTSASASPGPGSASAWRAGVIVGVGVAPVVTVTVIVDSLPAPCQCDRENRQAAPMLLRWTRPRPAKSLRRRTAGRRTTWSRAARDDRFRRRLRYHQARWREAHGHPIGSQPIDPRPDERARRLVGSRLPLAYAARPARTS